MPFNVDIGVGDIIVPKAEERRINTQLPDFEKPVIALFFNFARTDAALSVITTTLQSNPLHAFAPAKSLRTA